MEILLLVVIAVLIGFIAFVLFGYGIIGTQMVSAKASFLMASLKTEPHWDEKKGLWQFGAYKKTEFGYKKHGEWHNCFPNGESEVFHFDKGITKGVYQRFSEHKEILEEGTLTGEFMLDSPSKSIKIGEWKSYYINGRLKSKGNYNQGKKDGEWSFYDENNGELVYAVMFKLGKQLGN